MNKEVFITGGTGYLGTRLIKELLNNNYTVYALVRKGSEKKLPAGTEVIFGNVLDAASYQDRIPASVSTFVHLVGVAHPGPLKKKQFIEIDLASVKAAVDAGCKQDKISHFVYLSVAQPNRIMADYTAVRIEGEKLITEYFSNATFLRPFYVLGPGHYWPLVLVPLYKLFELIPSTKEKALHLGLVSIRQMIRALVFAVENPANGVRVMDVKEIKKFG
jgi:uncharacterized protein YbjT (DUF2867 family)